MKAEESLEVAERSKEELDGRGWGVYDRNVEKSIERMFIVCPDLICLMSFNSFYWE